MGPNAKKNINSVTRYKKKNIINLWPRHGGRKGLTEASCNEDVRRSAACIGVYNLFAQLNALLGKKKKVNCGKVNEWGGVKSAARCIMRTYRRRCWHIAPRHLSLKFYRFAPSLHRMEKLWAPTNIIQILESPDRRTSTLSEKTQQLWADK